MWPDGTTFVCRFSRCEKGGERKWREQTSERDDFVPDKVKSDHGRRRAAFKMTMDGVPDIGVQRIDKERS
jgi:hypothetical protein